MTRKRSINRDNWKKNKMKKAYQSGKAHVNSRAKQVEAKKDCFSHCKFKCHQTFNEIKQKIFLDFYKLDATDKHSFINQTSVCVTASSKTVGEDSSEDTRRKKEKLQLLPF